MTFLRFDFQDERRGVTPLCFGEPLEIVTANTIEEVRPALRAIEAAALRGCHAAGYIGYEAAPAFDAAHTVRTGGKLPLLWFGIYERMAEPPQSDEEAYAVSPWTSATELEHYRARIAAIREAIARGETYQVNYTLRLAAEFSGDALNYYRRLLAAQRPGYGAYLDLGGFQIVSASPELFFGRRGDSIVTRPMKGTAPRGRWAEDDVAREAALRASAKDIAENVMIVDLLRNDLGRIAVPGSVRAAELCAVERYPTVFQLTSTIEATQRPGTSLEEVFAALFPCGSVTGAPKISTMRLIAELEDAPREVYCGAIGYVRPGGDALFNVAIRTAWIDSRTGSAEYGVGGGITWDSDAEAEYREAFSKAAVLEEEWPEFDLLETLRLENGVYTLLERHLQRLTASAHYFEIPIDQERAWSALQEHAAAHEAGAWRVRLLVSRAGEPRCESTPLMELPEGPFNVQLATAPLASTNRFLYHKTTHRSFYEAQRKARPEVFDVLLWNEREEVTEFINGNLVAEIDGILFTPPLDCGLLPGTLRAELLATGKLKERIVTTKDVQTANRLWFINSVRGWVPVTLLTSDT